MKIEDGELVFSDGTRVYCNLGIVGIDPEGAIYEGYDGTLFDAEWPVERRRELAEHMIERWQRYLAAGEGR